MVKRAEDFQLVEPGNHLDGQSYYTEADIDRIIAICPTGLPETMVGFPTSTPDGSETVLVPTDRRTVLRIRLNDSVTSYLRSRNRQEKPPPSKTAKQFQRVEASLRKSLDALGLPEGGNPDDIPAEIVFPLRRSAGRHGARIGGFPHYPPMDQTKGHHLDPSAPAVVKDVIQGLQCLLQWSAEAKAKAKQEMRPRGKRHTGDLPIRDLIGDLVGIWIEIFNQDIRTSVGAEGSNLQGRAGGPMIRFIQACIEPLGEPLGFQLTDEAIRERIRPFQRSLRPMVKSSHEKI
jgi:hypothetical protein